MFLFNWIHINESVFSIWLDSPWSEIYGIRSFELLKICKE